MVVSDNGASGEGGPDGSVNENKIANGVPDDLAENLAKLDELGSTETYNHYPNGWAMAFNTPFKMWKRYSFNGGTCDPCIISWPEGIDARGEIRDQYHHAIDVVPTLLDCVGVDLPDTVKGYTQHPIQGVSMRYSFDAGNIPTAKHTQFYSMLGGRGIWHDGWKAVTTHPTLSGWGHFSEDTWELYHTELDRAELRNLADEEPGRLAELVGLWFHEAGANQALPLDDRSGVELLTTPRPQLAPPRNRYVYPARAEPRCRRPSLSTFVIVHSRSGPLSIWPSQVRPVCFFRMAAGSVVIRCTSRTTACITCTTSSAVNSRRSMPPKTFRSAKI